MLVKQVDIDNDIETEIHSLNLKTKYLRCDLITLFEPFCCNSNHDNLRVNTHSTSLNRMKRSKK